MLDWFIVYILLDIIFRSSYSINLSLNYEPILVYEDLLLKVLIVISYFLFTSLIFKATIAQILLGIRIVSSKGINPKGINSKGRDTGYDEGDNKNSSPSSNPSSSSSPSWAQVSLRVIIFLLSNVFFFSLFFFLKNKVAFHDAWSGTQLYIKND